jgi:hypothetical protein
MSGYGHPHYPSAQAHIEARSIPEPNTGCWLWLGRVTDRGYGKVYESRYPQEQRAHRVAYRAFVGDIPAGMLVCHRCDIRACVNPEHLFLGTALDNTRDMVRKGRARFKGNTSTLTTADVLAIRSSPEKPKTLAVRFGVSDGHIRQLRRVNEGLWPHAWPALPTA